MSHTTSTAEVHRCALDWLLQAGLLRDVGRLYSATVIWNVLLRAAARSVSIFAACRDLAHAPSDDAVFSALVRGLPKTRVVLERRVNETLTGRLPRWLRRRAWQLAIDLHLKPYYGRPQHSRNELYYGEPKQGTSKFHAYATACIVQYGQRYVLALTWVRRHETLTTVVARLLATIAAKDVKIKCLLLDRAFYNVPMITFLLARRLRFLMPVVMRGRPPKKGRAATGLRLIKRQPAGWYVHVLRNGQRTAQTFICVAYRTHKNRKDRKRVQQKLLFAAWGVSGTPTEIRERYRLRFGIESSYRQMRQALVPTCTRNPHLRLVLIAVALILRNLWVWLHGERLGDGRQESLTVRYERLRFRRLLDWLVHVVVAELHDGTTPCVEIPPSG
jgi:hypothetical protein